jgi:hypothetical protein
LDLQSQGKAFDSVGLFSTLNTTLTDISTIKVAALSTAWTVFARLNAGIVGSNPTQGIDVCVRLFCLLGSGLAMGWSPVQGVLPCIDQETEKAVKVQQRTVYFIIFRFKAIVKDFN